MAALKTLSRYLLGALFVPAGLNHFVMTDFYVGIMTPYLPWPLALVYLSGVTEVGVGILLLFRRWAVWGGWGIIVVCLAVFPANLHMALRSEMFPQFSEVALWVSAVADGGDGKDRKLGLGRNTFRIQTEVVPKRLEGIDHT